MALATAEAFSEGWNVNTVYYSTYHISHEVVKTQMLSAEPKREES